MTGRGACVSQISHFPTGSTWSRIWRTLGSRTLGAARGAPCKRSHWGPKRLGRGRARIAEFPPRHRLAARPCTTWGNGVSASGARSDNKIYINAKFNPWGRPGDPQLNNHPAVSSPHIGAVPSLVIKHADAFSEQKKSRRKIGDPAENPLSSLIQRALLSSLPLLFTLALALPRRHDQQQQKHPLFSSPLLLLLPPLPPAAGHNHAHPSTHTERHNGSSSRRSSKKGHGRCGPAGARHVAPLLAE